MVSSLQYHHPQANHSLSPCAASFDSHPFLFFLTALQHLRKVVRLLDKENDQFRKDCDQKMAFQKKQEERLREENERLRIKVNDMSRPKVSVLAQMEERRSQLLEQVEVYQAKIEIDQRRLEDLDKVCMCSCMCACASTYAPRRAWSYLRICWSIYLYVYV